MKDNEIGRPSTVTIDELVAAVWETGNATAAVMSLGLSKPMAGYYKNTSREFCEAALAMEILTMRARYGTEVFDSAVRLANIKESNGNE